MWPTCAMRWCWARFGGAHRESSPSIYPRPRSSFLHEVALGMWSNAYTGHSFQSLQAIPDEKCHLWVGVRKLRNPTHRANP